MNLLIKERREGKTTGLIYTSEATQYPIVTFNRKSIECIKERAEELGCLIPEPLCIDDIKGRFFRENSPYNNILLDEAENVIEDALNEYLGTNVVAATISNSLKEHYKKRKMKHFKPIKPNDSIEFKSIEYK